MSRVVYRAAWNVAAVVEPLTLTERKIAMSPWQRPDDVRAWLERAALNADVDLCARPDVAPQVLYVCAIGATDMRLPHPLPDLCAADAVRLGDAINARFVGRAITVRDVAPMLRALAAEVA